MVSQIVRISGTLIKRASYLLFLIVNLKIFDEITELKKKILFSNEDFMETAKGNPLVSVIVPTRNDAENLSSLLLTIQRQSFRNTEVIVADYKSTDGTPEIAKNFGAKVLNITKKGIGHASHMAALHSKGQIIIRTDADTFFPKWIISRVVNVFNTFPHVMLVHGGHIYVDAGFFMNFLAHLYDKYWKPLWGTRGIFIATRRSAYFSVGGFSNILYGEDFHLGRKFYMGYGKNSIYYDPTNIIVVTSVRGIKANSFMRYILEGKTYTTLREMATPKEFQ